MAAYLRASIAATPARPGVDYYRRSRHHGADRSALSPAFRRLAC
ncbi:MAG: hypothetical protein ACFBWO_01520 [Paracoccaceae bacterium]